MSIPYDSIVSQYSYHEGGAAIPVSKLVNMTALSTMLGTTGGGSKDKGAENTEIGSALKRLEHLGVPAGLVFLPPKKHANIEYADKFGKYTDDDVIDDVVYDNLVGLVSEETDKKPKRGTRKRMPKTD